MIYRRDKENTYLIVMVSPKSDKGKGYLKSDNKLWFYDPISRRFILTSAKDRFQNLNARNSDFTDPRPTTTLRWPFVKNLESLIAGCWDFAGYGLHRRFDFSTHAYLD